MLRLVDWSLFTASISIPLFCPIVLPYPRYFCPRLIEVENVAGPKISVFIPTSCL